MTALRFERSSKGLRSGLAVLGLLGLAACTASRESKVAMEHACQTKACICSETNEPLLSSAKTAPLQWRGNGDAFCPEGFSLRFAD